VPIVPDDDSTLWPCWSAEDCHCQWEQLLATSSFRGSDAIRGMTPVTCEQLFVVDSVVQFMHLAGIESDGDLVAIQFMSWDRMPAMAKPDVAFVFLSGLRWWAFTASANTSFVKWCSCLSNQEVLRCVRVNWRGQLADFLLVVLSPPEHVGHAYRDLREPRDKTTVKNLRILWAVGYPLCSRVPANQGSCSVEILTLIRSCRRRRIQGVRFLVHRMCISIACGTSLHSWETWGPNERALRDPLA